MTLFYGYSTSTEHRALAAITLKTTIHIAQYFFSLNYHDTLPYVAICNFFWLSLNVKLLLPNSSLFAH